MYDTVHDEATRLRTHCHMFFSLWGVCLDVSCAEIIPKRCLIYLCSCLKIPHEYECGVQSVYFLFLLKKKINQRIFAIDFFLLSNQME